jgi:hypothetical protein
MGASGHGDRVGSGDAIVMTGSEGATGKDEGYGNDERLHWVISLIISGQKYKKEIKLANYFDNNKKNITFASGKKH